MGNGWSTGLATLDFSSPNTSTRMTEDFVLPFLEIIWKKHAMPPRWSALTEALSVPSAKSSDVARTWTWPTGRDFSKSCLHESRWVHEISMARLHSVGLALNIHSMLQHRDAYLVTS